MIKIVVQRLFGRWIDEESPLSPRWLVEGEDAQPPGTNSFHYARIYLHLVDMHAYSDDIVEIKLKEPLELPHLPPCLARGGDEVPQDADNCVLREETSINVVGGHGGHPLSSEVLVNEHFWRVLCNAVALNSQQKLIYNISHLPPKVNPPVKAHYLRNILCLKKQTILH